MGSRYGCRLLRLAGVALLVACAGGDEVADETSGLLVAEPVSMNAVRLAWPRGSADARSYRIERRLGLSGDFTEVTVVPAAEADTLSYLDATLAPESYYGYRVRALGGFGDELSTSTVAGARTPSRPGIKVRVSTSVPTPEAADPDGYVVRVLGPDSLQAVTADSALFKPLQPGTYDVLLEGLVERCRVNEEGPRTVEVTDVGLETLKLVEISVTCRDPNRGEVVARVTLTRGEDADGFRLTLTGRPDAQGIPDSLVFREEQVPGAGGTLTFAGLRPGTYQLELAGLASNCTASGGPTRSATVAALTSDTVDFAVACVTGSGPSGDFRPPTASKPYKLRYRWSPAQASVGQTVQLIVSADLGAGPAFELNSITAVLAYDRGALQPASGAAAFAGTPPFNITVNSAAGRLAWVAITTTPGTGSSFEIGRATFTVIGGSGSQLVTTTQLTEVADFSGNPEPYTSSSEVLLEAPLAIGSPGNGGGNQAPTSVIAGGPSLAAIVGVPLSLSSAGSADPDGTITAFQWTLAGGSPSSATGASSAVTYAAAGTYTIALRVTDDDGASDTATANVTVSAAGGGANQPPSAVITGGPSLGATVGTPLALLGSTSSDPDGTITRHEWTLTGGTPSSQTGASASVTYAAPGTYPITLTVTDNGGASASATATVTVTGGAVGSQPFTWRGAFGPAGAGEVRLALTLDLTTNIPETPLAEAVKSFVIDSIAWNPAVLEFVRVEWPSNLSGSSSFSSSFPGRVGLSGRFVGDGPGGIVSMGTIVFRVKGTGSATTVTGVRSLVSTTANGDFNYASRTRVVEGAYPSPAGLRAGRQ